MGKEKLTLTDLAVSLGVSVGQASKCAARGMPTDDLEAARQWRLENLHWKARTARPIPPPPPPPPPDPVSLALREAVPVMLFSPEIIAAVATDAGIAMTAEQARKFTAYMLCVYMAQVDDLLGTVGMFRVPPELSE